MPPPLSYATANLTKHRDISIGSKFIMVETTAGWLILKLIIMIFNLLQITMCGETAVSNYSDISSKMSIWQCIKRYLEDEIYMIFDNEHV